MEITKDEKEFMIQVIADYWDNMEQKKLVNNRRKKLSDCLVKKLNLYFVSKRSELFCDKGREYKKCERYNNHINGCNFCDLKAK